MKLMYMKIETEGTNLDTTFLIEAAEDAADEAEEAVMQSDSTSQRSGATSLDSTT